MVQRGFGGRRMPREFHHRLLGVRPRRHGRNTGRRLLDARRGFRATSGLAAGGKTLAAQFSGWGPAQPAEGGRREGPQFRGGFFSAGIPAFGVMRTWEWQTRFAAQRARCLLPVRADGKEPPAALRARCAGLKAPYRIRGVHREDWPAFPGQAALSASRRLRFQSNWRFAARCVAFRSEYTRYAFLTRVDSRAPRPPRCSQRFHHRLLRAHGPPTRTGGRPLVGRPDPDLGGVGVVGRPRLARCPASGAGGIDGRRKTLRLPKRKRGAVDSRGGDRDLVGLRGAGLGRFGPGGPPLDLARCLRRPRIHSSAWLRTRQGRRPLRGSTAPGSDGGWRRLSCRSRHPSSGVTRCWP